MKRHIFLGIFIGWLLSVTIDRAIGYEYYMVESATPTTEIAQLVNDDGWEIVNPSRPNYLRRRQWALWATMRPAFSSMQRVKIPQSSSCFPKFLCAE